MDKDYEKAYQKRKKLKNGGDRKLQDQQRAQRSPSEVRVHGSDPRRSPHQQRSRSKRDRGSVPRRLFQESEEVTLTDLRTLAWRLQGVAHFLQYTDPNACPSEHEMFGIGDLIREAALEVEAHAEQSESRRSIT